MDFDPQDMVSLGVNLGLAMPRQDRSLFSSIRSGTVGCLRASQGSSTPRADMISRLMNY